MISQKDAEFFQALTGIEPLDYIVLNPDCVWGSKIPTRDDYVPIYPANLENAIVLFLYYKEGYERQAVELEEKDRIIEKKNRELAEKDFEIYYQKQARKRSEIRFKKRITITCPYPMRDRILRFADYTCQMCGEKNRSKLSIDRRVPGKSGGLYSWDNVGCLCRTCNSKKGNSLSKRFQYWVQDNPYFDPIFDERCKREQEEQQGFNLGV